MGWETRGGGGAYYYVCRRVDGQVKKLYFGDGPVAHAAALLVEVRKAKRAALRAEKARAADRLGHAVRCQDLAREVERYWPNQTLPDPISTQTEGGHTSAGRRSGSLPDTDMATAAGPPLTWPHPTATGGVDEPVTPEKPSESPEIEAWIAVLVGDAAPARQQVRLAIQSRRLRLAAAHPGPIAALLIDSILAGWLRATHFELETARLARLGKPPSKQWRGQQESATRHYTRLLAALERFRTLPEELPPG